MSTSANAMFFYGICWDTEDHRWNWRNWRNGAPLPVSERIHPDDEETTDQDWVDTIAPGLEVGKHCSTSAPMGYIAIAESHHVAWRGLVNRLDPAPITADVPVEWQAKLRAFCLVARYDYEALTRDGKIGWFLVSWWSA